MPITNLVRTIRGHVFGRSDAVLRMVLRKLPVMLRESHGNFRIPVVLWHIYILIGWLTIKLLTYFEVLLLGLLDEVFVNLMLFKVHLGCFKF